MSGGDIFDLSKSKRFLIVPYASAVIGGIIGAATTTATSFPAVVGITAASAFAGGILLPAAVGLAGAAAFIVGKGLLETIKTLKKEGSIAPFFAVMVGYNCAAAMTAVPARAIKNGLAKIFNKKTSSSAPAEPTAALPTPPSPPQP